MIIEFIILAGMMSTLDIIGIIEGYLYHPIMYVNSAVIFVMLGYFGYQDRKNKKDRKVS